ncbi:MAG: DUF115 domain-containing protein [Treponema sp.]|nr:DUF115 domain-containing protein [Treponema sp.]
MDFLPGSIILVCSPVLEYGLKELDQKLTENCIVLLCEADKELWDFERERGLEPLGLKNQFVSISEEELFNLPVILQKPLYTFEDGNQICFAGNFRRVIRLDFSAGVQFHSDFYDRLESACVNSVKQFWTNRFTLARFGRRYSRNMFRNLKEISGAKSVSDFIGTVCKTVFVFGAGESAEIGVKEIKQKYKREMIYILCADTAFSMLKANGIWPDGIVIDEAQSIIAQSFIGARNAAVKHGVQIFQSLCSLPHVAGKNVPKDKISFYGTEYSSNTFFDSLKQKDFFPPVIPAFGSVGITAYILACLVRKDNSVPVYDYGLDFAYSAGKTHARGTPAHKRQIRETMRLRGPENFGSAFGENVIRLPETAPYRFTTPILASYAETFRQVKGQVEEIVESIKNEWMTRNRNNGNSVSDYLASEKDCLLELRDLLSGKGDLTEEERSRKIYSLLENRQYLYLHFPDGYKLSMELNFLKRIRGEIDGFLKDFQ